MQISVTLDAEELLPEFIRRRFVRQKWPVYPKQTLGLWRRFREDLWGKEHWDSVEILKKQVQMHTEVVSSGESVS